MPSSSSHASIRGELERVRLEHKRRRLDAAVRALDATDSSAPEPPEMRYAIAEFRMELDAVRRRLRALTSGR